MKEKFQDIKFTTESRQLIEGANVIIGQYQGQGYDLTVRQLYYQFVTRNWLANNAANYDRLASVVSDGRLAGLIDWDAIADRGRVTYEPPTFPDIASFLQKLNQQYRRSKWKQQGAHVEVMVEKQALEGVLAPVCAEWEVPFTANKGYGSSSLMYARGKYLQSMRELEGKEVHVIYLGDHDPSGLDMSRDIEDRLCLFSNGFVKVHRIALNIDQVETWDLPENPAKLSDSRAAKYVERFGSSSWELDALPPDQLADMVETHILNLLDRPLWDATLKTELAEKNELQDIIEELKEEKS